jgi:phage terminase small subunit
MPRPSPPAQLLRPVVPPQPERLRPPETLSAGAKAEFVRIVLCEKPEHFRTSDLPLLTQYCESVALAARATVELQRDDAPARWLTLWEKANRNMVALAARLRLCPQSRQPNNPKRPERTSFYDRMMLEGECDGPERPDRP